MWRIIVVIIGLLFLASAVVITVEYVRDEIRKRIASKRIKGAFKLKIIEAKKNKISVGIFTENDQLLKTEIITDKSSEVRVRQGQVIYL